MVQSNIELEFKPEVHPLCYLLDAPILLSVAFGSYLLGNVFKVMPNIMLALTFGALVLWLFRFIKFNRACDETEVTVYVDRIESEVGMKNPKLTMIEFSNFVDVQPVQSFVQKIFKTYSLVFTYKSDFTEKDITYVLRDFKDPRPICKKIKEAVAHAGLIAKMSK